MNETILVVDDEREIADFLEIYLKNDGYTVHTCSTGAEALRCVESEHIDLALLDVMLPDIDGFSLCRKIRESRFFPILMLTARVADSDKILGLTIGATTITSFLQPAGGRRAVKTQLHSAGHYNQSAAAPEDAAEYDIRGLIINRESHKCTLYGRELALTPIEFSILWYLCSRQGRVVPSEELFEAVWKEKYLQNSNNTVMAHIARLREKMNEPPRNPKFIKTVWGVGYEIE